MTQQPGFTGVASSIASSPASWRTSVFYTSIGRVYVFKFIGSSSTAASQLHRVSGSPLSKFAVASWFSSIPGVFTVALQGSSSDALAVIILSVFFDSLGSRGMSVGLVIYSFLTVLFGAGWMFDMFCLVVARNFVLFRGFKAFYSVGLRFLLRDRCGLLFVNFFRRSYRFFAAFNRCFRFATSVVVMLLCCLR